MKLVIPKNILYTRTIFSTQERTIPMSVIQCNARQSQGTAENDRKASTGWQTSSYPRDTNSDTDSDKFTEHANDFFILIGSIKSIWVRRQLANGSKCQHVSSVESKKL